MKFSSDEEIIKNRYNRGVLLKNMIPSNLGKTDHFIYYDWADGRTLYEHNSLPLYLGFLNWYSNVLKNSKTYYDPLLIKPFYDDKTEKRKNLFLSKYGSSYYTTEYIINGKKYPSLRNIFSKIDFSTLDQNPFYKEFHGDLQFDNILYSYKSNTFTYIDWRESFAGSVNGGDLYYDLSKLYGGCILPYNLLKDDNHIEISEGMSVVNYSYDVLQPLSDFQNAYEKWIVENGYDFDKIKLIKSLIYLNMSPLHSDKFSKLLWFKSIEGLHECVNK